MPKLIDLAGSQFGRLTVISSSGRNRHGQTMWTCLCQCGKQTLVPGHHLRYGATKSCGCQSAVRVTHNLSKSRVYRIWSLMIDRCTNQNTPGYVNYGGRGIFVCNQWRSFEGFYADMGDPPIDCSLDRINNDGPYSPENCRWATSMHQANNKRTTRIVELRDGTLMPLAEACRAFGLDRKLTHQRLKRRYGKARWYLDYEIQRREGQKP